MNYDDIDFSKENQTRGQKCATLDQVKKDPKRSTLGQGKGLVFHFMLDEVIHFPSTVKAWPIFRDFNGGEVMYIAGFSEKRNRFVQIPISAFRRIPAGEGEIESFYDEDVRPLNCRLAEMSTDLERFYELCEARTIVCFEIFDAHGPVFDRKDDGSVYRVKDELKDIVLYSVKPCSD